MKPEEVVRAFFDTLNASGPEAASEYLAEAYTQQSDTPVNSRAEWVGMMNMFGAGISGLIEDFEILCTNGKVVHGINHITAVHTGDFDLSHMGLGVIPATGKRVQAVFAVAHTVENGKITSSLAKPVANMGFEYVLAQIGVEVPQPG